MQDALRAANRSAVQTFDYAAFAENRLVLADADTVIAAARRLAAVNLHGASGLTLPPEAVAERVSWTALPSGGACLLEPDGPTLRFPTPVLCAVAEVELVSPPPHAAAQLAPPPPPTPLMPPPAPPLPLPPSAHRPCERHSWRSASKSTQPAPSTIASTSRDLRMALLFI